MEYRLEECDLGKYDLVFDNPVTLKDFIAELQNDYSTCHVVEENSGDVYNMDFGDLKSPISKVLLDAEVDHIWLERKRVGNWGMDFWYTVRLKPYEVKIEQEELEKQAMNFLPFYRSYLNLLTKRIFKSDNYKILDLGSGIKCDVKGPYVTCRYLKLDSKGNYIDEGFVDYYFSEREQSYLK